MGTSGDDIFTGTSGGDTYFGGAGKDKIRGKAGNDKLYGGDDRDRIDGGIGNDHIYGGNGNDALKGGKGNDILNGGSGKDAFLLGTGVDHFDGGTGLDLIVVDLSNYSDNAFTVTVNFAKGEINNSLGIDEDTFVNIEGFFFFGKTKIDITMIGDKNDNAFSAGAGNDVLHGWGGKDLLFGGKGNDQIFGGLGNDKIRGADGNDILKGGPGRDRLDGNKGDDVLFGGSGNDLLRGRLGADDFHFGDAVNSGRDTIADFLDDVDEIHLKASNLWTGTRDAQDVLDDFGSFANSTAKFDFGGGNVLIVKNVAALNDLVDDIVII
jgi:Ca2+-binding RTX toxin-like protein